MLTALMLLLSHNPKRFNFRHLHALIKLSKAALTNKTTYRSYQVLDNVQETCLRWRKKVSGTRLSLSPATHRHYASCLDFMSERLTNGRHTRILTIAHDYFRKCSLCLYQYQEPSLTQCFGWYHLST